MGKKKDFNVLFWIITIILISSFTIATIPEPTDDMSLGELIINSGKFEGFTVYKFLEIAEKVLGWDTSLLNLYGVSMGDMNYVAPKIYEN